MAEYFTQKCEICGKEIVTHGAKNWGYKIKEPKGPYKFFCSYKCQRKYEKDHTEKKVDVIAKAAAEEAKKPKKMPTERGCIARSLIDVIRAGEDPIKYLQKQGYKNPYEAYSSVRHYCETNEPHLTEVLKPLKELRKGPQQKTGRLKKTAQVETVEQVPPVEEKLEPVQCIAHVKTAEIQEAIEKQEPLAPKPLILQGGIDYQVLVDEAMKAEVRQKKPGFRYEIKTIETEIGDFSYDRKDHLLIFRRKDEKNEFGYQYLSMSTAEWDKMLIIVPQLADLMGVTL